MRVLLTVLGEDFVERWIRTCPVEMLVREDDLCTTRSMGVLGSRRNGVNT